MAAVQLEEVHGLHQHVVEFEEGEGLLPVQAELDGIEGQHPVDGEMDPVLPQEVHIAQPVEPVRVVDHHRTIVPEGQEGLEGLLDAGDVGVDLFDGQHGPLGVLSGRVANLCCPATHQDDGTVPGLLQPAQHHDLDQRAHMQAGGRGVEPDIGRDRSRRACGVQRLDVRGLVDEAAFLKDTDEVGFRRGHGRGLSSRRGRV